MSKNSSVAPPNPAMDGVININKASGMTSHDVVLQMRRILREKRIGHTGTLDPMATGVLVLCVGSATRIARYLEAGEKEYRATMRLGVRTDTLDADGRVLETVEYAAPAREAVAATIEHFIGDIQQAPPIFSAVKVGGVPSYRRAREGNAEPNKPRTVTIHEIELEQYDDPFATIRVRCAKGVYIRTLCSDIGDALGMGAHVTVLQRTRSGRFTISDARTTDEIEQLVAAGTSEKAVMTINHALVDMPGVVLDDEGSRRVLHGNRIDVPREMSTSAVPGTNVRLVDAGSRLLAVAVVTPSGLQPETVFL